MPFPSLKRDIDGSSIWTFAYIRSWSIAPRRDTCEVLLRGLLSTKYCMIFSLLSSTFWQKAKGFKHLPYRDGLSKGTLSSVARNQATQTQVCRVDNTPATSASKFWWLSPVLIPYFLTFWLGFISTRLHKRECNKNLICKVELQTSCELINEICESLIKSTISCNLLKL